MSEEKKEDAGRLRVALVTGANGVIGKYICRGLLLKGYQVIACCRSEKKGKDTVAWLKKTTGSKAVGYAISDVSLESSIKKLSGNWEGPLDVLVNNAAITPKSFTETSEGRELQFATNVLGYYWMAKYFHPFLNAAQGSRMVFVASNYAGGLDMSDPEFRKRSYNNNSGYRASKQANRLLCGYFSRLKEWKGVTVACCHPGVVESKILNGLGFGSGRADAKGAERCAVTPVFCATSPKVVSGKHYSSSSVERCPYVDDVKNGDRLAELCEKLSMGA